MPKKLQEALLKSITLVPGIVGLAAMDLSKSNTPLKEDEWDRGMYMNESPDGIELSIAIIVSKEINAKEIAKEINSSLMQVIGNNEAKLANLNIYMRGAK